VAVARLAILLGKKFYVSRESTGGGNCFAWIVFSRESLLVLSEGLYEEGQAKLKRKSVSRAQEDAVSFDVRASREHSVFDNDRKEACFACPEIASQ